MGSVHCCHNNDDEANSVNGILEELCGPIDKPDEGNENGSLADLVKKIRTKKFNLGSEYRTRDPEEVAKELLKREYCATHLYAENKHEAIFIPHVFVSGQHQKLENPDLNFNGIDEFKMCMKKIIKDTTLEKEWYFGYIKPVSYTHLTLPTICSV